MLEYKIKINCSYLLSHQILGKGYTFLINNALENRLENHRFFYIFKRNMISAIILEIFSEL